MKMYMDANTVAIYEGDDDVIQNPNNRLSDVFFHSDLNYMRVDSIIETSVTLPAVASGTSSSPNILWLGNHQAGPATPIVLGYVKNLGAPLTGSLILDVKYDPARIRQVDIVSTGTMVGLLQTALVHSSAASYPAMTLDVICAVFKEV